MANSVNASGRKVARSFVMGALSSATTSMFAASSASRRLSHLCIVHVHAHMCECGCKRMRECMGICMHLSLVERWRRDEGRQSAEVNGLALRQRIEDVAYDLRGGCRNR